MPRRPSLQRPISPAQLRAELAAIWRRGRGGSGPRLVPSEKLSRTNARNPRRFAETDGRDIFVAPEILVLPKQQRTGLLGHECGHFVLWGVKHSEADADRMAREVFGVAISYSNAWPGRGLQTGRLLG